MKRANGYRKFYQPRQSSFSYCSLFEIPSDFRDYFKYNFLMQESIIDCTPHNYAKNRVTDCMSTHSCKKSGYQAQSRESEFKIDMDLLVLQNLRSNDLHTHLGNLKNRPPFHLQPHTSSPSPLQLSRDRNLQLIIELL